MYKNLSDVTGLRFQYSCECIGCNANPASYKFSFMQLILN